MSGRPRILDALGDVTPIATDPTTEVDLYWEARGSGPAILLIAGTPGDGGQFEALVEELCADHLVITYDRRMSLVHLHGGIAPVRRFPPELMDLITNGDIHPGKVFDLSLPLEDAAEGYGAMDDRRAVKTLLAV